MPDAQVSIGQTSAAPAATGPKLPAGWFEFTVGDKTIVASDRLTTLENVDLIKALGQNLPNDWEAREIYRRAANIRSINGDPVAPPRAESEIRAIIARVGDDVMDMLAMRSMITATQAREELKAAAKKLQLPMGSESQPS